jgi:para-nitrobenzyl esterase
VDGGTVVGVQTGEVVVFKGIPYAAPPVRGLRWKPPQPVVARQGELIADRFSPMCLQPLRAKNSLFYLGEEPTSEDCLYLNVWSGAKAGEKKPVMVFVYGGGWTVGSGSLPLYSGESLAKQGVVVVTFNYRLGAMGFFAHPALTAEGGGTSGNYGLMDMIAALKWVKNNIERFGGDAGRVTLYGQSAGAAAISLLMVAPDAAGLFHRAIGQSGAYAIQGPYLKLAEAEAAGTSTADKLRARDLQALRDLGGDAVMAADNSLRPIVDGKLLPLQPSQVYGDGKQLPIPILVGSNADEGTAYPVVMNAAAFEQDAKKRYGVEANAFLVLYPAKTDNEARAASYALMRDRTFAAPVRRWAAEQARVAPVFAYHFSRAQPFVDGLGYQQQTPATNLGAYHGAEMAYAYGTLDALNRLAKTRNWTDEDRKYSRTMMSYWVSFATKADPNLDGLPAWQPYKPEEEQVLLFGRDIRMGDLPNKAQLDFFKGP